MDDVVGDMAEISISELVDKVKGRLVGNLVPGTIITGTCAIDKYIPGKVSFIRNRQYGKALAGLRNAVVLVPEDLVSFCEKCPGNTYIIVEDVLNSMMDVQGFFYSKESVINKEGISSTAKIDKSAGIGSAGEGSHRE